MFTIQVDRTFQQFMEIFYRIKIWQHDDESDCRRMGKKLSYVFFGSLYPTFFATNAILCADRSESIFSIQIVIMTAVVYVKFLYLLFKKQEILAFLYDEIVVHAIESREEFEQTDKKIRKFMGFVRPYCWSFYITTALLIVSKLPIFSADKALPFFISFSWNDSEIIYWLAYLFVSVATPLFATINLITPIIWYMMLNYSIEYELLGNKLSNLGVEKESIQRRAKNQNSFRLTQRIVYGENLIALVKAHLNLNETVARFRSCFSTLFLGQITTCGIVICASVFNLAFASMENVLQIELYVVTLLYGLFDIFLVMYLANDITIASNGLSYRLFESNWIEQTESCKKCVVIMGEVLKQPQELFILIYPMNLETFMTVINGTYTMFNILKSFE